MCYDRKDGLVTERLMSHNESYPYHLNTRYSINRGAETTVSLKCKSLIQRVATFRSYCNKKGMATLSDVKVGLKCESG